MPRDEQKGLNPGNWLTILFFVLGMLLSGATTYAAMSSRVAVLESQMEELDLKEIRTSLADIKFDLKAVKLVVIAANPKEAAILLER